MELSKYKEAFGELRQEMLPWGRFDNRRMMTEAVWGKKEFRLSMELWRKLLKLTDLSHHRIL
jgi:hypothetical protein